MDSTRRDPAEPSKPRGILVQIWFPAARGQNISRAKYLSRDLLDSMILDRYMDVDLGELEGWDRLQTHSLLNAKPLAKKVPLCLFSPGFGMSRASYTTIAEELASRGVCVAGIDHPYGGLSIAPDGRLLNYARSKTKPEELVRQMAVDDSFVLTKLLVRDPSLPEIDVRHVVAAGHSIGGAAALQVGRGDRRFAGTIDLDGSVWGNVEAGGTRLPFMVLLNRPGTPIRIPQKMREGRTAEWKAVLDKSPVSATVLTVGPADHFTFSDAPFLLRRETLVSNGATLSPLVGRDLIASLLDAFIRGGTTAARSRSRHFWQTSLLLQQH